MRKFLTVLVLAGLGMSSATNAFAGVRNYDLESNFGFRVSLEYAHNDIAAADGGSAQIPVAGTRDTSAGDQANVEYVMPFAGRVIGIGVASNAALTQGIAHFHVTVNGSIVGASTGAVLRGDPGYTGTNTQYNYVNLVDRFTKSSSYTFSAGDRIGVSMNTNPTHSSRPAPTTADIVVTVIVDQNAQE